MHCVVQAVILLVIATKYSKKINLKKIINSWNEDDRSSLKLFLLIFSRLRANMNTNFQQVLKIAKEELPARCNNVKQELEELTEKFQNIEKAVAEFKDKSAVELAHFIGALMSAIRKKSGIGLMVCDSCPSPALKARLEKLYNETSLSKLLATIDFKYLLLNEYIKHILPQQFKSPGAAVAGIEKYVENMTNEKSAEFVAEFFEEFAAILTAIDRIHNLERLLNTETRTVH